LCATTPPPRCAVTIRPSRRAARRQRARRASGVIERRAAASSMDQNSGAARGGRADSAHKGGDAGAPAASSGCALFAAGRRASFATAEGLNKGLAKGTPADEGTRGLCAAPQRSIRQGRGQRPPAQRCCVRARAPPPPRKERRAGRRRRASAVGGAAGLAIGQRASAGGYAAGRCDPPGEAPARRRPPARGSGYFTRSETG
jgi:hypothetical protein